MRSSYRYAIGLSVASLSLFLYLNVSNISQVSERLAWPHHPSTVNSSLVISSPDSLAVLEITANNVSCATYTDDHGGQQSYYNG